MKHINFFNTTKQNEKLVIAQFNWLLPTFFTTILAIFWLKFWQTNHAPVQYSTTLYIFQQKIILIYTQVFKVGEFKLFAFLSFTFSLLW